MLSPARRAIDDGAEGRALMVVDRIERHDVVNAVLLAVVLLLLGFGIITAVRSLASTLDNGLIESSKETVGTDTTAPTETSAPAATETTAGGHPAGEVLVRVANGANRAGVAGAGSDQLSAAGYQALPPKNATAVDVSAVYYLEGYDLDAQQVANVLGIDGGAVQPMPADPGVPLDGAHVLVVVGADTALAG